MTPQGYLILALALSGPATYGYMWLSRQIAVVNALAEGEEIGAQRAATAINKKSSETVADFTKGETAEVAPISPEKAKLMELCQRHASCRERTR